MTRRSITLALSIALASTIAGAAPAAAARPFRDGDAYTVRFFDDFIFDLCGIETMTTLTERWTFTDFGDGRMRLHVTRTFVPDDPRIPIEKGAGSRFIQPDGTEIVVGTPLLLFDPDGGVQALDAGRVVFGDEITSHGRQDLSIEDLEGDLSAYYCP
jgi:hypothetical protein